MLRLVKFDFDSQIGSKQKGNRPAPVISSEKYRKITITRAWIGVPIHISLDEQTATKGLILCDQIKTVDLEARGFAFVETVLDYILKDVLDVVSGLML